MLQPLQEHLIKTVDELLDSEVKIEKFVDYENVKRINPRYEQAEKDNRVLEFHFNPSVTDDWKYYTDNNVAANSHCDGIKNAIEHLGDGKSWNGLYLVPDVSHTVKNNLLIRPFHPYLDEFQRLIDVSIKVGLPKAWGRFYTQFVNKFYQKKSKKQEFVKEEILEFNDIVPFFVILAFGFSLAFFSLICEIFYHDFLSQISRNYLMNRFEKFWRRKMRVRRVQVRPAIRRHRNTIE